MIGQGVIKERVMKAVKARIDAAQKQYEDECRLLEQKLKDDKTSLADKIVEGLLAKIV